MVQIEYIKKEESYQEIDRLIGYICNTISKYLNQEVLEGHQRLEQDALQL